MVDFGIGQDITSHCHARDNLPETWTSTSKHNIQSTKHLVSLDAYYLFIATTITEAFSEFIKFEYFQWLVTSTLPKLIYFMQSS